MLCNIFILIYFSSIVKTIQLSKPFIEPLKLFRIRNFSELFAGEVIKINCTSQIYKKHFKLSMNSHKKLSSGRCHLLCDVTNNGRSGGNELWTFARRLNYTLMRASFWLIPSLAALEPPDYFRIIETARVNRMIRPHECKQYNLKIMLFRANLYLIYFLSTRFGARFFLSYNVFKRLKKY